MDELIILIIKGLIRLFGGPPPKRTTASTGTWTPSSRTVPQPPAILKTSPPNLPAKCRQALRRLPPIPVAAPILTAANNAETPITGARRIIASSATAKTKDLPSVDAAALRKWLTPSTLRRQFFLTEALRPPLALRDEQ